MKRERPVPLVVLALASLLLGGLGLIAAGAAQVACIGVGGPGSPGLVVPLRATVAGSMRRAIPGFLGFEVTAPGSALVLSALTMATGLILLFGGRWARPAAMAASGVILFALSVAAVYEFVVVLPQIEEHREKGFMRNLPDPDRGVPDLYWVAPLLLIWGLVLFVHAVAMLVVLQAPVVAEAFRRGSEDG
jgi:hypothetical protein